LVIWGQVLQTLGEAMVRLFQGIEQNMDHVPETQWTRVIPPLGHLFAHIAISCCDYLFMWKRITSSNHWLLLDVFVVYFTLHACFLGCPHNPQAGFLLYLFTIVAIFKENFM